MKFWFKQKPRTNNEWENDLEKKFEPENRKKSKN